MSPGSFPGSGRCVIIVDPKRPDVFDTLQANFRERVIWDRRAGDRRRAQRRTGRLAGNMAGRRQAERRGVPRATWQAYGFVLAPRFERVEPDQAGR